MTLFDPRSYQRDIARFLIANKVGAVFADPGTGKTASTLAAVKAMLILGLCRRALIIAPKRVAEITWPDELRKWAQFRDLTTRSISGSTARKMRAINSDAALTFATPDIIPWLATAIQDRLPWDTLIIDESTKFKNNGSKRFKALKKLLKKFERRYILTGTPTPNSAIDLWAQFFAVDLGETLGSSLSKFHTQFCYKGGFKGREWILHEQSQAEIERLIAPKTIRIDRADYLDMPDLITNDVWVELSPSLAKEYRTLERKLFLELDNGDIFSPGDSGSSYRLCRQYVNGGFYVSEEYIDENGELARRTIGVEHRHNLKIEAARDLIEELNGKPVLVCYLWNHDLERLEKSFGPLPVINGKTSNQEAKKLIDRWNRKEIPILAAQPQAMSHGLNMQTGGNAIIWLGLPDDQDIYEQTICRVYRSGVVGSVTVHRILARRTIDEAVALNLADKSGRQKSLLDAIKRYRHQ